MRAFLLGHPDRIQGNGWKGDLYDGAIELGWDVRNFAANEMSTEDVVRQAKECDIFIWARRHRQDPAGDAWRMLREIEDAGVPTVGIHMDLYWGIPVREPMVNTRENPWWSCRHVFTADGGHETQFASAGANHMWMPPAMGPRYFGRAWSQRMARQDILFVGSNSKYLHGGHRNDLIRWAKSHYGPRFMHRGVARKFYGAELSALYDSTRIILGDSAPADRYWSDRIPTALGRGAILAHPNTTGLEEQGFDNGNMILFDRFQFGQIADRVESMSDKDLRRMSDAALTVVAERHMWQHRLQQIASTVL